MVSAVQAGWAAGRGGRCSGESSGLQAGVVCGWGAGASFSPKARAGALMKAPMARPVQNAFFMGCASAFFIALAPSINDYK